MVAAILHSNGQQKTENDRDMENRCQKPAVQLKTTTILLLLLLLMMMMTMMMMMKLNTRPINNVITLIQIILSKFLTYLILTRNLFEFAYSCLIPFNNKLVPVSHENVFTHRSMLQRYNTPTAFSVTG